MILINKWPSGNHISELSVHCYLHPMHVPVFFVLADIILEILCRNFAFVATSIPLSNHLFSKLWFEDKNFPLFKVMLPRDMG